MEPLRFLFVAMSALVIKSFPDELHKSLKEVAFENRRSVTQETIRLIEDALLRESASRTINSKKPSYWATRKRLPELSSKQMMDQRDSTEIISEERNAR